MQMIIDNRPIMSAVDMREQLRATEIPEDRREPERRFLGHAFYGIAALSLLAFAASLGSSAATGEARIAASACFVLALIGRAVQCGPGR